MKRFYLLIFPSLLFCGLRAQTITGALDKDHILIGEPFHLRISGSFSKQPASWIVLDSLPHFEILARQKIDTQQQGKLILLSQEFTLTSWDSGRWQIPSFQPGRSKPKPLIVDVAFSPHPFDATQPYHDIRDIIEVKKPVASKWYWYLVLLGIILVLFLLFFPKEKKKKKPVVLRTEDVYQNALRQLDELGRREKPEPKIYHTELIRIFRQYLHGRKNIYSYSKTTDDLAIQMHTLDLPKELHQELLQALRMGDLVKFARYRPSAKEDQEAWQVIKDSIIIIEKMPHAV